MAKTNSGGLLKAPKNNKNTLFIVAGLAVVAGLYFIYQSFAGTDNLIVNSSFERADSIETIETFDLNQGKFINWKYNTWYFIDHAKNGRGHDFTHVTKRSKSPHANHGDFVMNFKSDAMGTDKAAWGATYVAKPLDGNCSYKLTGEALPLEGTQYAYVSYLTTRNRENFTEGKGWKNSSTETISVDPTVRKRQRFEQIMNIKNSKKDHFIVIDFWTWSDTANPNPKSSWNWDHLSLTATCK